jgi:hypothetical protein
LVNWKAGQVRNGNQLLLCFIPLVTLPLLEVAAVAQAMVEVAVRVGC